MKKTFDTIAWVRKVRDRNYRLTKNMTVEEKIAFYRKGAETLHKTLGIKTKDRATRISI